ncbi:aspartic proteinase nepenthesin-1-like [Phragmites australis]|uniref:aspartic proteinase nepenthesin-1-like n=1 Tax=Phragmites australis TaxID=29695 RepID=UPI002D798C50|nr:aspartic proteinase nepenthesin-1-like [Phragmites australis]
MAELQNCFSSSRQLPNKHWHKMACFDQLLRAAAAWMSLPSQMASLTVIIFLVCATLASGADSVRVGLTRIHSDPGVTASQFVRDALRRDMHRHAARFGRELAASDGSVSAQTRLDLLNGGEYLMTLAIGTPPLVYPAIADTGSDLIWTQCAPCGKQCFKQPVPLYNPSSSTTFGMLPCNSSLSMCAAGATPPAGCACMYNQTYGTGWTAGVQSTETFTFGSAPVDQARVPGIAFGCSNASSSNDWNGSAGLVGLGRGSLSLVSQLGAGRFSYCLTPFQDTNSTSTLLLGLSAALNGTGVRSTPFVASPAKAPRSTYYYLNLTGISLGTTALPVPSNAFSLKADGTGGLIIDSGTTITSLVDAAYQQVRVAVKSLVTLPTTDGSDETGLDLCFALPSSTSAPPAMPSMTLHFDGADMVLLADSYMISGSGLWCLAMVNQTNGGMSTLGNYQQQNMHILYDVRKETLSFVPAKCSTL